MTDSVFGNALGVLARDRIGARQPPHPGSWRWSLREALGGAAGQIASASATHAVSVADSMRVLDCVDDLDRIGARLAQAREPAGGT